MIRRPHDYESVSITLWYFVKLCNIIVIQCINIFRFFNILQFIAFIRIFVVQILVQIFKPEFYEKTNSEFVSWQQAF